MESERRLPLTALLGVTVRLADATLIRGEREGELSARKYRSGWIRPAPYRLRVKEQEVQKSKSSFQDLQKNQS